MFLPSLALLKRQKKSIVGSLKLTIQRWETFNYLDQELQVRNWLQFFRMQVTCASWPEQFLTWMQE